MGYCLGIDPVLLILKEPLPLRFSPNRPISCTHRKGTSESGLLVSSSFQALTKPIVQPRLFNPTQSYIDVTQKDLLSSLKTTIFIQILRLGINIRTVDINWNGADF